MVTSATTTHAWWPWAGVLYVPKKKTRREAPGSSLRFLVKSNENLSKTNKSTWTQIPYDVTKKAQKPIWRDQGVPPSSADSWLARGSQNPVSEGFLSDFFSEYGLGSTFYWFCNAPNLHTCQKWPYLKGRRNGRPLMLYDNTSTT